MYFQDDWRISSKLTLNIGVRYDLFVPDKEIRNRLVNFDQTNLRLASAGEGGISETVAGKEHTRETWDPESDWLTAWTARR